MNSILKIFFQQTEQFLRLTKTTLHAYQLQKNLADDEIILFDRQSHHSCVFAYDLQHELTFIEKYLRSTCFRLQRALFHVQAKRQIHANSRIHIDEKLIVDYEENLSMELKHIDTMIESIINEYLLTKSPLNNLQSLFREIHENFQIILDSTCSSGKHKSTIYLGNLVSNTLERFYLILNNLVRFVRLIEEFEIKPNE